MPRRWYIDTNAQEIWSHPTRSRILRFDFQYGDTEQIEIRFVTDGVVTALPDGNVVSLRIKQALLDSSFLVPSVTAIESGDGPSRKYTLEPSFTSTALAQLFGSANAVPCYMQVSWTSTTVTRIVSPRLCRIERTLGQGVEPSPITVVTGVVYAGDYGVRSSNTAAGNTASLENAIATLAPSGGKIVLPASGSAIAINPIVLLNKIGIIIEGQGTGATVFQPSSAAGGGSVIKFSNCRDMLLRDLRINGNSDAPPNALIETRVEDPRTMASYGNKFQNIVMGSDSVASQVNGLQFTADTAPGACNDDNNRCDLNNEQHTLTNLRVVNCSGAGLSIEHSNSLLHKLIGGEFYGCAVAVRITGGSSFGGGSFSMIGTSLIGITDVQFDFGEAVYRHPIFITNVNTEQCARILRTAASSSVRVFFTGYNNTGTAGDTDVIDFASLNGTLSFVNSFIEAGQTGAVMRMRSATQSLRMASSRIAIPVFSAPAETDVSQSDMIQSPIAQTGRNRGIALVSSDYTVNAFDDIVLIDASAGDVAVMLPVGLPDGNVKRLQRFDATGNTVTIGSGDYEELWTLVPNEFRDVMATPSINGLFTTLHSGTKTGL